MNDKEIKKALKNAYKITPSDSESDFLGQYGKRSTRLWDILLTEVRYMGMRSLVSLVLLFTVFYLITRFDNSETTWFVSGAMPVIALMLTSGLGRSERYGMQELEGASRFSLRFIKTVRMFILGITTLIFIVAISILLCGKTDSNLPVLIGVVGTPYMISVFGNLLITRRWHAKENIIGCLAVTALSCMLPVLMEKVISLHVIEPLVITGVFAAVMVLAVRESVLYTREREDLVWN